MIETSQTAMTGELRKVLKRLHYPLEIMLVCARWYAAYPLSLRHIEEMMQKRGVFVDHATVHRCVRQIGFSPDIGFRNPLTFKPISFIPALCQNSLQP
jgi:transposase-like protein